MVTPRYSQRPADVEAGRRFLHSVLARTDEGLPTYQQFADSYGGIPRGAAAILNSIAADCARNSEPDLTALVVNASTGLPTTLQGQAVAAGDPATAARWQELLTAIRTYPWPDTAPEIPPAPRIGQEFANRSAIADVWGGDHQGGMATFPHEAPRVVNIFSDDNGPYPDRRVPGTDRIEYVGQGRTGHQKLTARGNSLMEEARSLGQAARYWYRPTGGVFTFERWVVIVGRHREWHRDLDGAWRIAYVYDLAPVGSPSRDDWDLTVQAEVDARSVDDSTEDSPPDATLPDAPSMSELYQRLVDKAAAGAGKQPGIKTATEYARSAAARNAVLLRANGNCEYPKCAGMACDVRPDGTSILDVDHVRDLAEGGADQPWNMAALCPNCHAAKTRGRGRGSMRMQLLKVATVRHAAMDPPP